MVVSCNFPQFRTVFFFSVNDSNPAAFTPPAVEAGHLAVSDRSNDAVCPRQSTQYRTLTP